MRSLEGRVIAGKYRLIQHLGEGGFGAVYRASHVAYELELREVAIKLAKRPMELHEARSTFSDALVMARVKGAADNDALRQHFVTVHDAGLCPQGGELAGHPYVVMELVEGGSLRDCLKAGPFPLRRAVRYFDQTLEALAFMHKGVPGPDGTPHVILHRDIKPDNILVVRRSEGEDLVKLTDFGLAIEVGNLLGWAQSGGDLAYLAPESFSRNICSPQSDIYMLALVFYEMLTKQGPFLEVGAHLRGPQEENHDELRRIHVIARQQEKFALLEQHPEIQKRPAIGEVIRQVLAFDMNARPYRNACELLDAWREAKAGEMTARPERPWQTVSRLAGEAQQCLDGQDDERALTLLRQAMEINRDPHRVPDPMVVGDTYLMMVNRLLREGRPEDAGRLAFEGYRRRKCRSTCKAMARYHSAVNPALASRFEREAQDCEDRG